MRVKATAESNQRVSARGPTSSKMVAAAVATTTIALFGSWTLWTDVTIADPTLLPSLKEPLKINGTATSNGWPSASSINEAVGGDTISNRNNKKKRRGRPTPNPSPAPTVPVRNVPPFVHPKDRSRFGATNVLGGEDALYQACIVESPPRKVDSGESNKPVSWNATRHLVLYGQAETKSTNVPTNHAFEAGGETGKIEVLFKQGPPPAHIPRSNSTAFFIGSTCEANMDHFLGDEFLPLFSTMEKSHSLRPHRQPDHALNRVFYARDLHSLDRAMGPNGGYCHNPTNFDLLIEALDVEGEPQAYWGKDRLWGKPPDSLPPPMAEECFRHAVVVGGENADPAAAMRYAANNILGAEVEKALPTTTTIIQRGSTRRILNIDAVVGLLREMRFPNIQVVDMSANTTKEQMQIVRCSGLLIGSFGAALAWSTALEPSAFLVELLWPRLPPRYIYSCKQASTNSNDKTTWGKCQSRYNARAGYVRMKEGVHDPSKDHIQGNPSKKMNVNVDIGSLKTLLTEAYGDGIGAGPRRLKSHCGGDITGLV